MLYSIMDKYKNQYKYDKTEKGKEKARRYLDHCHQTGTIRNIICRACNTRDYKIKQPIKEKREYQKSFGGRTDCDNNSLLKIDVNLFL